MKIDVLFKERPNLLKLHPWIQHADSFGVERADENIFKVRVGSYAVINATEDYCNDIPMFAFALFLDDNDSPITSAYAEMCASIPKWKRFLYEFISPKRDYKTIMECVDGMTSAQINLVRSIVIVEKGAGIVSEMTNCLTFYKMPKESTLLSMRRQYTPEDNKKVQEILKVLEG